MATPSALNITPMNPPSKELESTDLADIDYLIQDLVGDMNHLHTYFQLRISFIYNFDIYGIWKSNLSHYFLPSVNIFPEIIHLYVAKYEPSQRFVKSPSGSILFYITPDSINQMLNFKQTDLLLPFSMKHFPEEASWLPGPKIEKIAKTFMKADC